MQTFRKHPDLWFSLLLVLMVLAITLPFLPHAYHVDEPLFLRIAQQIKANPLNPYGFYYLWDSQYLPMSQIAAFPPLFPYYLALVGAAFQFPPEWLIHLSLIPFAWIAALSFYRLSRELEFAPLPSFLATTLLIFSPAFVVSANLAMPDVAAGGLGLLALVLAIRGWTQRRNALLIGAGILLGAAVLCRYNVVPLMFIFVLIGIGFRFSRLALLPSGIAALFLLFWTFLGPSSGGHGPAQSLWTNFFTLQEGFNRFWAMNNALSLSTFIPFFVALLVWPRSPFWALLTVGIGMYYGLFASRISPIVGFQFFPDVLFFTLGCFTLLYLLSRIGKGIHDLQLVKSHSYETSVGDCQWKLEISSEALQRRRNLYFQVILGLWVFASLCIPLVYVHFATKYLLYVQPPLILLLLYWSRGRENRFNKLALACLPVVLILSLSVAHADFKLAEVYRRQASQIYAAEKPPRGNLWFLGHWGWQYYLEKLGALPLPVSETEDYSIRSGDVLIRASYASPQHIYPILHRRLEIRRYQPVFTSFPVRTMNQEARAGLYSNIWGPLPFSFSNFALENFGIFDVVDRRSGYEDLDAALLPHLPVVIQQRASNLLTKGAAQAINPGD